MDIFIKVLFSLSVTGTFFIFILFLLKPFYKDRLSKKWQYYIWLVVITRLLFPFTVPAGCNTIGHIYGMGYSFIQSVTAGINQALKPENNPQATETVKNNIKQNTENINNPYITDTITGKDSIKDNSSIIKPKDNNINKNIHISDGNTGINILYKVKKSIWNLLLSAKENIFYIWLAVTIALFTRKVTAYQSFTRYLKAGQNESSLRLWEEMGRIIEEAGIKPHISLYTNSLVSSPLLTGFFHPCIIIPTEELDITDFRNIISHELVHCKRKDLFYKWLVQLTACIHWFNPFVYWIIHETGRLCELSCDEAVIKSLDTQGKKDYGNTLLKMAGTGKTFKSSVASVTLNESKKLLKERLDNIMGFKKKTMACTVLSAILTFTICITAVQAAGTDWIKHANNTENVKKNNNIDNILNINKNNKTKTSKAKKITYGTDSIDKAIEKDRVIFKNGIYYILADGVPEKDISTGSITDGCIGITLEQTDGGYISIAPLDIDKDLDGLVEYVEDICNNAIKNKTITKKEAGLLTGFAVKLVEGHGKIKGIKDTSVINKEYKKWHIKIKNGNYYYKNKRVRVFADIKPDKSFLKFSYDKKGTVDIKITRNKKYHIKNIKYLSKEEADEFLDGYF